MAVGTGWFLESAANEGIEAVDTYRPTCVIGKKRAKERSVGFFK